MAEQQIKNSRYHLGPLYLLPQFTFQNAGYVSNIFGTAANGRSDFTFTAGLGTQWIVPFSHKIFLRGLVEPTYIWYAHSTDARKFGWTSESSLLLLFNRLSIEASGDSSRGSTVLNSETDERVLGKTVSGKADFELGLTGHILLIGGGSYGDLRFEENPPLPPGADLPPANLLSRTESAARGGFRYRFSSIFSADAQYEKARIEFDDSTTLGTNESTAGLLGIGVDGNHFVFHFSGGYREGRPYKGSGFPAYSTVTGSYAVTYRPTEKISLQTYGHRDVQASLFAPYYFETIAGAGLGLPIAPRVSVSVFGETGANQYPRVITDPVRRRDKLVRYGGGLNATLIGSAQMRVMASETRYTSNVPGFTRKIFQIDAGVTFELRGVPLRVGTS